MSEGVKVGVLGIGVLVLLGAAFYVGRKLLSSQLPKVQKVSCLGNHCPALAYSLKSTL